MKLPANIESYLWGIAIIFVSVGTYAIALLDGDSTTHADINILLVGVTAGISKFRSAGSAETAAIKAEVKEVKSDVREVTKTVEESQQPIRTPFTN